MKNFEDNMNAFVFSEHQAFVTYLLTLEQKGLSIEDAKSYVKEKAERMAKRTGQLPEPIIKDCDCGAKMLLLSVNTTTANQTGDDSKSVWVCQNRSCLQTIYNKETVMELRSKGGT